MPSTIARFTVADAKTWHQVEGQRIYAADVVDDSFGYRLSVGYARLGQGEQAGVPAPYDEVWILTQGSLAIRDNIAAPNDSGASDLGVHAGDVVHVPARSPGVVVVEQSAELIMVAWPPRWQIDEQAWESAAAADGAPVERVAAGTDGTLPTDAVSAEGRTAPPLGVRVRQLGAGADVPLPTGPEAFRESTGKADADEVLVLLHGRGLVELAEGELELGPGELVYVPAGASTRFRAVEDAETVHVRQLATAPE